jgi:hypothetical protein
MLLYIFFFSSSCLVRVVPFFSATHSSRTICSLILFFLMRRCHEYAFSVSSSHLAASILRGLEEKNEEEEECSHEIRLLLVIEEERINSKIHLSHLTIC